MRPNLNIVTISLSKLIVQLACQSSHLQTTLAQNTILFGSISTISLKLTLQKPQVSSLIAIQQQQFTGSGAFLQH